MSDQETLGANSADKTGVKVEISVPNYTMVLPCGNTTVYLRVPWYFGAVLFTVVHGNTLVKSTAPKYHGTFCMVPRGIFSSGKRMSVS